MIYDIEKVVETVWKHFLEDGHPPGIRIHPWTEIPLPAYENEMGDRCAIGILMTEDQLDIIRKNPELNSLPISRLAEDYPELAEFSHPVYGRIQLAHDIAVRKGFTNDGNNHMFVAILREKLEEVMRTATRMLWLRDTESRESRPLGRG